MHTKIRMLQRHEMDIALIEYEQLCSRYCSGEVNITGVEKHQHIFETEFKGKNLKFVWCLRRKTITTVLRRLQVGETV